MTLRLRKPYRTVTERTRAALDALPATPGEIADYLIKEGITGDVAIAYACPVANYLTREVKPKGFDVIAWAGGAYPGVLVDGVFTEDGSYLVEPDQYPHVQDFAKQFDARQYPELIRWERP
jgi:hypothetical protein